MSVEEQIRSAFGGLTFQKGDNTRLPGKMQLHERLKFDGVIFRKGDNTRLPGKMQLHERLKFGEDGRPMLYVFENCRDFIRTIPSLVYDARRPEDIDTAGEDHIYDETRYFLMSRPIAPRAGAQPKKKKDFHPLDG